MTIPIDWDPTPEGTKKLPALVVPPIPGVLPFEGAHNPLTRSNTARRVSMVIPTPATKGVPQVYHFDGEREMAVALEALLSPSLFRLEVQLPKIYFDFPKGKHKRKNWPGHHFDLRLTFSDGHKRAVYVKNGTSLATRKTQDEITAICEATPQSFADDVIIVNGDHYTMAYRDNLRRLFYLNGKTNTAADRLVENVACNANYWYVSDLTRQCDLAPRDAWQSVMRLIGQRVLGANWYNVINVHSKVWLNA